MLEDFNKTLEAWGKDLTNEFPDQLPPQPNFDTNGEARMIWYAKGLPLGLKLAVDIGSGGSIFMGKLYSNIKSLTKTDKIEIAEITYNYAFIYWDKAHKEKLLAERLAKAETEEQIRIDAQIDTFRANAQAIDSREHLRILIDELKAEAAKGSLTIASDYLFSKKLIILHDRLIVLEKKESRLALSGWWLTLFGTALGLLGLLLGFIWGTSKSG